MTLKILYIHHCGTQGGSSRSLREMIQAFPDRSVQPYVISPKGTAADYFEKANIPVIRTIGISQFDMTQLGYYRKLRWLILLRELFYIPFTIIAILKAKSKWKNIDIIHVNDIQSIIPLYIAKYFFKAPIVLHVRCPIIKKRGKRFHFLKRFIKKYVVITLAIDETVKYSLPDGFNVEVIHNGLIIPKKQNETVSKKKKDKITIGMVSNLLVFKGVLDFVEAARLCKENNIDVDFTIIGGRVYKKKSIIDMLLKKFGFKHFVDEKIYNLIEEYHLSNCFKIEGFVQNLAIAYDKIDVLCFPSHINAVGRPVFEAGFFNVPSIVAIDDPYDDAIVNMETGISITQKSPEDIAKAITHFYKNPSEIRRMGENAYKLAAKNYNIHENASQVLDIYKNIVKENAKQ
ncbi:hypothetical protein ATO12_22865 [Aquimarina atlantica]|uniref:Glycosyl transferase family 1 domain-containing protein n=1 Tax=Aquimarina atlantica TaxID=1317122 RepID=A0A023BQF7_9FLAO|nr:glycosyltransferase family 4 protein [Aquimarina atlantica]EZH72297.1 hypothetical protein ATO12_22865 [Aquimarina atlantica]